MKKYKNKKQYRYKDYNYSQDGFYFVTICAKNRKLFFGDVRNKKIKLSDVGLAADKYWQEIPAHFPFVILDKYVVMPNHVHGIIQIDNFDNDPVGTGQCPVPTINIALFLQLILPCSYKKLPCSYKKLPCSYAALPCSYGIKIWAGYARFIVCYNRFVQIGRYQNYK